MYSACHNKHINIQKNRPVDMTRRACSACQLYASHVAPPLSPERNSKKRKMGDHNTPSTIPPLYVHTPLLYSTKLSELVGAKVWMKMETVQISGSFKTRGLSNFAKKVSSCKVCTEKDTTHSSTGLFTLPICTM